MTLEEAVREMRKQQKIYFRSEQGSAQKREALQKAKSWENTVDYMLEQADATQSVLSFLTRKGGDSADT